MGHAMDGWTDGCTDADWKGRVLARSLTTLTRPLLTHSLQQPGAERRSHGGGLFLLLLLLSAGRLLR